MRTHIPVPEETIVSNPALAAQIREALLTSAYVNEVVQVRTVEVEGEVDVVGVRVSLANVDSLYSLPPVLAVLRQLIREVLPKVNAIFVEPDVTEPRRTEVPTESIVIRSWD